MLHANYTVKWNFHAQLALYHTRTIPTVQHNTNCSKISSQRSSKRADHGRFESKKQDKRNRKLKSKEMEDKVLVEAVAKETDNTEPGQWRAWTGAGAAAAVATAITKIEMK